MAKWFIITGITLIVIGVIIRYAPWLVSWFGKLPGVIRIEKEQGKVYFPVVSMLVVSVVLTILLNLSRFLKK